MNRDADTERKTGGSAENAREEAFDSPDIDNMESDFGDIDLSGMEFGALDFGDLGSGKDGRSPGAGAGGAESEAAAELSGKPKETTDGKPQEENPQGPEAATDDSGKDRESKAEEAGKSGEPETAETGKSGEPKAAEAGKGEVPKVAEAGKNNAPKAEETGKNKDPETAEAKKDKEPKAKGTSKSKGPKETDDDSDMKIRVRKKKKRASSGSGDEPENRERESSGKEAGNKKRKKKKPEPLPDPDDYDDYDEDDDEELEEERESNKRWLIFLLVSSLIAAAVLGIYYGCTVRSVTVKGNKLYTSEQIADFVISDDTQLRHNTAFLTLLYHTPFAPRIPFVEKVDVMPTSYDAIEITVTDKELDAYIPYGGRNLYFNADGIVMENSPLTVKGVTYVTGITLNSAEIGMPLSSENSAGLFLVLDALQILRKYEIKAESIVLTQKGSITMFMDDIIVILGRSDFELKIAKIAQLRPYLEGRKGTIDLTNYSSSDQNIILK